MFRFRRILLLALDVNEKKINEANIRRTVNLMTSNNNVVNNNDLINQVNADLCLDVDSSSNSENNSSLQPSSKISIQKLFRKKRSVPNNNSEESGFFNFKNLKSKFANLKSSAGAKKLTNYLSYFNRKEDHQTTDQFQIRNQFLHSQLNPIFIDQLDCQDTSIKECVFKQYNSSTLKPNQINLVRLANQQRQQRVARLLKASNYHFNQLNQLNQLNQYDQINQFNRNQLISSSMKSDSLLVNTRRQHVRDQLIDTIKRKSKEKTRKPNANIISNGTPSSQLLIKDRLKEEEILEVNVDESRESKPDVECNNKQFYYFAQHCYTLPQKNKVATTNQIDHLMQSDTFDIKPSEVVDILNYDNSSAGNSSSSSSSNGNSDSTFKDSTEGTVKTSRNRNVNLNASTTNAIAAHNGLDRNPKTNKTLTTADVHLKNIPKNLKYSTSQTGNGQNGLIDLNNSKDLKKFQNFKASKQSTKSSRLNSNIDANSNTKYIVIDDTVFGD